MKAAVFQGKGKIEVLEVPTPEIKPGHLLVRVEACGVCGTDVHIFEGAPGAADVTPPLILGHEWAGRVVSVGEGVRDFREGDRVAADPNAPCGRCHYCQSGLAQFCEDMGMVWGGMAEYQLVPAYQAYHIADHLSFAEGSMAEPVSCCLHGIDMCGIKPGDTVMIFGAGGIGLIMLQLARLAGASRIIVSEPSDAKRKLALRLGACLVIDPLHEDIGEALRQNGADKINAVIECCGLVKTAEQAVQYAGKGSTVMLFGLTGPEDSFPLRPYDVFRKEVTIKSSYINPYTIRRAVELLGSGSLDVKSLVAETVPLTEVADVLGNPARRAAGKIIVKP